MGEKKIVGKKNSLFGSNKFWRRDFDLVEIRDWIDELKAVESDLDVRYRRGELAEAEFAFKKGKLQGLAKLVLDFSR